MGRRASTSEPTAAALDLDAVRAAAAGIAEWLPQTPLMTSATLGRVFGGSAYLKCELFQRTGSFKVRGVLAKLIALTAEEKRRGVISISAGNHAQALAYGCALEDVECTVVMWSGASEQKIAATREYGAHVDLEAGNPGEAFDRLAELQRESGRTLIHPFDDPSVIAGQGTVGLEILELLPDLDAVLVPVGGGGLVSGIATVIKELRPQARVIAVEPERSASLHAALAAGYPVRLMPSSIADGLAAPFVGDHCLAICRERVDESLLVTEQEIADSLRFLYERAKLAAEPAAAVAVAALLAGKVGDLDGKNVAVVVSGGNVSPETLFAILGRDEG